MSLPTAAATTAVVVACAAGVLRSVQGAGDAFVLGCLGVMVVLLAYAAGRVARGARPWIPVLVLGTLLLPMTLAGMSTIAYPGLGGLSSAEIQFVRAIESVLAGAQLGAPDARLTLYPTSFVALAAVAHLTGIDTIDLIQWSWVVSLPIMVAGFGLFVREWTGSRLAGSLGMLVSISNPWFFVVPLYDGFNLTLLPVWSYLLLRVLKRTGPGVVLCFTLVTAAIVTSHFFTSLFTIVVAVALGVGVWIARRPGGRLRRAKDGDAQLPEMVRYAVLIPIVAVVAWLVYVSERYLRDSAGLVAALLAAFENVGSDAGIIGLSLVSPLQVGILAASLGVYSLAATALGLCALRGGSSTARATIWVAVGAAPLVLWAVITPPQFSLGTDLKEWKVRPLFGAFVLVAPMLALGLVILARNLPRRLASSAVAVGVAMILLNAQTLSLGYSNLGQRTYASQVAPLSVEDGGLSAGQYREIGDYVRQRIPNTSLLVADWRQSNWMSGAGGLKSVPLFQLAALSDESLLGSLLGRADVAGVAVDLNLLTLPSIYTRRLADPTVVASLEHRSLDRVFDSGDQILYMKP